MCSTLLDINEDIFLPNRDELTKHAVEKWDALNGLGIKTVLDSCEDAGWFKANSPENVEVHTFNQFQCDMRNPKYDLITFWHQFESDSKWDMLVYIMPRIRRYVLFPVNSPAIEGTIESFCRFHGLTLRREISVNGKNYRLWENQ